MVPTTINTPRYICLSLYNTYCFPRPNSTTFSDNKFFIFHFDFFLIFCLLHNYILPKLPQMYFLKLFKSNLKHNGVFKKPTPFTIQATAVATPFCFSYDHSLPTHTISYISSVQIRQPIHDLLTLTTFHCVTPTQTSTTYFLTTFHQQCN